MRIQRLGRMLLVFATCGSFAAVASTDEKPVAGVWQKHEYVFSYAGFTSQYSCDGIADKVKLLLLAAGARDDLSVRGSCSDPRGSASRIAVARATFHTLAPAPVAPTASDTPGAGPTAAVDGAAGAWKAVAFKERAPSWLEAGDCELVEQFDRELLPLFTTRNRQSHMTCVPNQYQLGSITLRFEVFAPLPKPRAAPTVVP